MGTDFSRSAVESDIPVSYGQCEFLLADLRMQLLDPEIQSVPCQVFVWSAYVIATKRSFQSASTSTGLHSEDR